MGTDDLRSTTTVDTSNTAPYTGATAGNNVGSAVSEVVVEPKLLMNIPAFSEKRAELYDYHLTQSNKIKLHKQNDIPRPYKSILDDAVVEFDRVSPDKRRIASEGSDGNIELFLVHNAYKINGSPIKLNITQFAKDKYKKLLNENKSGSEFSKLEANEKKDWQTFANTKLFKDSLASELRSSSSEQLQSEFLKVFNDIVSDDSIVFSILTIMSQQSVMGSHYVMHMGTTLDKTHLGFDANLSIDRIVSTTDQEINIQVLENNDGYKLQSTNKVVLGCRPPVGPEENNEVNIENNNNDGNREDNKKSDNTDITAAHVRSEITFMKPDSANSADEHLFLQPELSCFNVEVLSTALELHSPVLFNISRLNVWSSVHNIDEKIFKTLQSHARILSPEDYLILLDDVKSSIESGTASTTVANNIHKYSCNKQQSTIKKMLDSSNWAYVDKEANSKYVNKLKDFSTKTNYPPQQFFDNETNKTNLNYIVNNTPNYNIRHKFWELYGNWLLGNKLYKAEGGRLSANAMSDPEPAWLSFNFEEFSSDPNLAEKIADDIVSIWENFDTSMPESLTLGSGLKPTVVQILAMINHLANSNDIKIEISDKKSLLKLFFAGKNYGNNSFLMSLFHKAKADCLAREEIISKLIEKFVTEKIRYTKDGNLDFDYLVADCAIENNFDLKYIPKSPSLEFLLAKLVVGEQQQDQNNTTQNLALQHKSFLYDIHNIYDTQYEIVTKLNLGDEVKESAKSLVDVHNLDAIKSNLEQYPSTLSQHSDANPDKFIQDKIKEIEANAQSTLRKHAGRVQADDDNSLDTVCKLEIDTANQLLLVCHKQKVQMLAELTVARLKPDSNYSPNWLDRLFSPLNERAVNVLQRDIATACNYIANLNFIEADKQVTSILHRSLLMQNSIKSNEPSLWQRIKSYFTRESSARYTSCINQTEQAINKLAEQTAELARNSQQVVNSKVSPMITPDTLVSLTGSGSYFGEKLKQELRANTNSTSQLIRNLGDAPGSASSQQDDSAIKQKAIDFSTQVLNDGFAVHRAKHAHDAHQGLPQESEQKKKPHMDEVDTGKVARPVKPIK